MTGLVPAVGSGITDLCTQIAIFREQLKANKTPLLRRGPMLFLKAAAVVGYSHGRHQAARTRPRGRSSLDDGGAVRVTENAMPSRLAPSKADGEVVVVVIAALARNNTERRRLSAAVAAVSNQTRPPEALIVVDDGAVRPLTGLDTTLPHRLLRHTVNAGPAAARNTGLDAAAAAGASLVAFTDSDCAPSPFWIQSMVDAQQGKVPGCKRGVVSGRTEADGAKTEALVAAAAAEGPCSILAPPTAAAVAPEAAATAAPSPPPSPAPKKKKKRPLKGSIVDDFHDLCGTLNGRILPDGSLLYGCTCNLSMALRPPYSPSSPDVDGTPPPPPLRFDQEFREAAFEDVDFCVRARKAGVSLSYAERALVHHDFSNRGVWGLAGQFRRYGAAEPLMAAKHPEYTDMLRSSVEISSYLKEGEDDGGGRASALAPSQPPPSSAAAAPLPAAT